MKLENITEIIIGYYGAVFWGGGTYAKLSKKPNENFKIEFIHSAVPNYIPNGEKYIKLHDRIDFSEGGYCHIKNDDQRLTCKYTEYNQKIKKLIKKVANMDLDIMSKTKYDDEDMLDGLCWKFYIKINKKEYCIKGYENMPRELEKLITDLQSIANKSKEI